MTQQQLEQAIRYLAQTRAQYAADSVRKNREELEKKKRELQKTLDAKTEAINRAHSVLAQELDEIKEIIKEARDREGETAAAIAADSLAGAARRHQQDHDSQVDRLLKEAEEIRKELKALQ
jgi:hypothetical protein